MPHPFFFNIFNNVIICEVDEFKYLGVTISKSLKWASHIQNICTAAYKKLGFLRRKLRNASLNFRLLAYNSLCRLKLEYASVVWDPHRAIDVNI